MSEVETERKFKIVAGDKAWVENEKTCYEQVTVKEANGDEYVVFNEEYKSWKVKEGKIWPVNPPNMDGVEDNTQMMHLHDPSLLHNLRVRYFRDEIYSYTAYILIAINPYKKLSIYTDETIKQYAGKSIGALPPHVYAIADRAYRSMKSSGKNQSIVVSGESGAGKTETCKFIMRYFAVIAGKSGSGALDELETKILEANPILEAFGNAKTLRNNNSSRFGKYTELHFNEEAHVVGASIVTYLLEKSRLVGQSKGERNFHVFYQLLTGASEQEKKKWKLAEPQSFHYLKQSDCFSIDGVDDKEDYQNLKKYFSNVGISDESQSNIFQVLSGLLHLGNVNFSPLQQEKGKKQEYTVEDKVGIDSKSMDSLVNAAELLGIPQETLKDTLVNRTITVGSKQKTSENTYTIQLTEQEAIYARDALAKYIYGSLFDWIVATINKNIPCPESMAVIGILDISGFELFENNSFEQLCINFANERIQQYFNYQILSQEQEIYLLEGLKWRKVEYEDNQDVINLIDIKQTGVLDLLDEECIMPKGSDQSFTTKVHTTHSTNSHLSTPRYSKKSKGKRLNKDEGFVLKHFAGSVCYNTENFLDKNNDTLHKDLENVLFISTNDFLKHLFSQDEDVEIVGGNKRFKSVSRKFRNQLNQLMESLYATTSHFIRCIKPNELQKPALMDNNAVMTQLRYNGMCTALELMQIGFPTRIGFQELYNRYAHLMPHTLAKLKPITFCEAVLVALDLHGGRDFQMGLTKVFFRAGKLQFLDELTNNSKEAMNHIVGKVRKWLARKRWKGAIHGVISLLKIEQQLLTIRRIRNLRKTGRFWLKVVRIWLPLVDQSRKALLASEEYKRRIEEEKRRQEELRQAEIRRREEEERIRREKKEAKRRAREEAKRALENERDLEIQARKDTETKLDETNNKLKELESLKNAEEQKVKHLELQVKHLEEKVSDLTSTVTQKDSDTQVLERDMKDQIYNLKNELIDAKNQVEQLQKEVHSLKEALENERNKTANLEKQLEDQKQANKKLEEENSSLNKTQEDLEDKLRKEEDTSSQLRAELDQEKTLRLEENQAAAEKIHQIETKTSLQISQTRTEYSNLESMYNDLRSETDKEREEMKAIISQLTKELAEERSAKEGLQNKHNQLTKDHQEAQNKIQEYMNEKKKLVDTAVSAQSDQRKLKIITENYTNQQKIENMVKIIYGDLSYNTLSKGCTKQGEVRKQGGENKGKWQKRFLVLNDNYLLYYSSPSDKEPKGVVAIDPTLTATSKVDLTKLVDKNLGINHTFTIKKIDKTGRAFYFACASEEDCSEWLRVLLLAQGWSDEEVEVYLDANFENRTQLRSIKGRLVLDD